MTQELRQKISQLDQAIKENDLETIKTLFPKGIKTIAIKGYEYAEYNALQRACFYGHPSLEMIKYFVDNGINVNNYAKAKSGSPLALLCHSGTADLKIVKFLVENGARLEKDTFEIYSDGYYARYQRNTYRATPLQILLHCHKGQNNLVEMCQFLIEKGCPIDSDFFFHSHQHRSTDYPDSDAKITTNTLGAYCSNSDLDEIDHKVIKCLLVNKQDPNQIINSFDNDLSKQNFFYSCLHKLIRKHQKIVDLTKIVCDFLVYGADTQIKDDEGKVALDYLTTGAINYEFLQNLLKGKIHEILFEKEFEMLWERKELTDFEIHGIKCHKQLIEVRTKQDPEIVKKTLEIEYSKNISENFLKWVYGQNYNSSLLDETLIQNINIQDVIENSMAKSWDEAYLDETKKDFTLLVTWKFDPEDEVEIEKEEEEEEEEEEEVEIIEIKIHKTLLFARLGLFREMFTKLEKEEEEISQVTDHSEKRVDTMTIFVGFLYKNKIETSGDYELKPKVLKEIVDLPQYFQMNDLSSKFFETNLDL
ncbi:ankyrin repeat-containing protein [Anaeramoeba flamelloides]|uniref:Ankyrin repeat-containing protein n=1 Tax=Anaeramoeba flamelloides TaxID=1746091 RepID=A0ABQ8ZBV3_9EUKA|nr:ankyrin repeat-containing protein [Anaeramoeba flamelloides]